MINKEQFSNYLEWASKEVKTWPEWKQGVLGKINLNDEEYQELYFAEEQLDKDILNMAVEICDIVEQYNSIFDEIPRKEIIKIGRKYILEENK